MSSSRWYLDATRSSYLQTAMPDHRRALAACLRAYRPRLTSVQGVTIDYLGASADWWDRHPREEGVTSS
jgi:hypothetical protein